MRDLGSIDFVFLPLGSWFDVLRGPSAWLCLVRWTGYDHSSISASGKRSRWPTLRYGIASRSTSFLAWRSVILSHSHSSSSVSMRAPLPYTRLDSSPVMRLSRLAKVLRQSAGHIVGGSARSRLGLQLDLLIGPMLRRTACAGGLWRPVHGVALDGLPVRVLDSPESCGYPGLAGGDGLAVAPTVG